MTILSFGQFLQNARARSGKTQKELAAEIGEVVQATVSAWEREKQLPPSTKLAVIAEAYGVDPAELQNLLAKAKIPKPTANRQFTEECFLEAQQQHIDQIAPDHIDVWVLGFGILQLLSSPAIRDSWRDNLQKGADYHIVWIFDVLFPAEHRSHHPSYSQSFCSQSLHFLGVMEGVGKIVRGNEDSLVGQIYHYPVVLSVADGDASMIERYNEWKEDNIPSNVFYDIRGLPSGSVIPIMGYCGAESATILHVPPTILFLPLAVNMLRVAKPPYPPTSSSQVEHLFTFLDADQTIRLGMIASDFRELFGAHPEKGQEVLA